MEVNKVCCETNQPNKAKVTSYRPLISLKVWFYWLYTSNKMERFSYEGGCDICIQKYLTEVLAWAIVKHFRFSNDAVLLETVNATKLPKNKAVSNNNIVYIAMWSLITV